jgi:pimeloyl-ACP methyl ester carboxylesterase
MAAVTETHRHVVSRDRTPIAVFSSGDGPPLILVHGSTADHTTWRATGPVLERTRRVHAVDRRGRGDSGDADGPYSIGLEYDDLAAVADAVADEAGAPVDVVGHSYGGRIGLGAALRAPEGGETFASPDVEQRIADLIAAGERDEALQAFFTTIVGMSPDELALYRADPIWPRRVAAVHTSLREIQAESHEAAASLEALGAVSIPVLQILGGDSRPVFRDGTADLDARLANGRVVVIDGARHAAHHTHVGQFVSAIEAFLGDPNLTD